MIVVNASKMKLCPSWRQEWNPNTNFRWKFLMNLILMVHFCDTNGNDYVHGYLMNKLKQNNIFLWIFLFCLLHTVVILFIVLHAWTVTCTDGKERKTPFSLFNHWKWFVIVYNSVAVLLCNDPYRLSWLNFGFSTNKILLDVITFKSSHGFY